MSQFRPVSTRPSRSRFVGSWARVSDHEYVHVSGARIERRGHPEPYGWYLLPTRPGAEPLCFPPTPQGCDDAFVAFAAAEFQALLNR